MTIEITTGSPTMLEIVTLPQIIEISTTGTQGPIGNTGPTGPAGSTGSQGRGISSVVRTNGTGAPGTTDTYTITFSDATTSTFTIINGSAGAAGPPGSPTAYDLRGTGFPEGVVTAIVGTRYVDTDGTNGAIEWIKATGTGNTGWRVIYGDTGWRNLAAYVNTTIMTAGTLYWRRTNSKLTISIHNMTLSAASGTIASGLPAAADPWGGRLTNVPVVRGNGVFGALTTNGPGNFSINGSAVTTALQAQIESTTDVAWPTTLPGTAV